MSSYEFNFSEGDLARVRDAYAACVDLVDTGLEAYEPERDDVPKELLDLMGEAPDYNKGIETVRYHITEPLQTNTMPGPYSAVLEKASIVALQKIDRLESPKLRKIELLDPFRVLGGATLLMLGIGEKDNVYPAIPEAKVSGEAMDYTASSPFFSPDLTDNLLHMAATIKRLAAERKLEPVNMEDVQAMYSLSADLENPERPQGSF